MDDHEPDQATGLRALAGAQADTGVRLPALTVTGGKGGVGKTSIAVNLALLLKRMGLDPLLVDCDLGLANADVLLGISPRTTLYEVMRDGAPLDRAVVTDPRGLALAPAASGRDELTRLPRHEFQRLLRELGRVGDNYDLLVLDTSAGIHSEVTGFVRAARLALTVITPDPTSLTDAYALIKVSLAQRRDAAFAVVVNQASGAQEAQICFQRLRKVVRTYLDHDLTYLGHLPADRNVREAVRARVPFVTREEAPATRALKAIALRLKRMRWKAAPGG